MELFTVVPTLQRMALLKVVTLLWNEDTIHKQLSDENKNPQWDEIKKRISENVEKLEIPSSFKKVIAGFLEAVGYEIISWWKYHIAAEDSPLKMPHEFNWTLEGTIDLRKTTENLVRRDDIDIVHRYFWACYYSLEREIPILWDKIDKTDGEKLANQLAFDFFVSFWTFKMDETFAWLPTNLRGEFEVYFLEAKSHRSVLFDFCYADFNRFSNWLDSRWRVKWRRKRYRYSVGAEYFWHKLTADEKRSFFTTFVTLNMYPINNDIMYFIFSQSDEERKNEILKKSKGRFLLCLLQWPKHTLFLEFAKRSWDFIPDADFLLFSETILKKAKKGTEGFTELFGAFWNQSPDNCKIYIYHNFTEDFIKDVCTLEGITLILSILDSLIHVEKEHIFHSRAILVCKMLVFNNCLDLFREFVTRHLPSVDSVVKFRNIFKETVTLPTGLELSSELPCSEFEQLQKALLIVDSIFKEIVRNEK